MSNRLWPRRSSAPLVGEYRLLKSRKLDVFGRVVLVAESGSGWIVFYLGAEGKRRPAKDIVVPPDILESEIEQYLGDLCHEWATEQHPSVKRLD